HQPARPVPNGHAELGDRARAFRPLRRAACAGELFDTGFVWEARQILRGLRAQYARSISPLRYRLEPGHPAGMHERMHEGGDEDGLAGVAEASHAESHPPLDDIAADIEHLIEDVHRPGTPNGGVPSGLPVLLSCPARRNMPAAFSRTACTGSAP